MSEVSQLYARWSLAVERMAMGPRALGNRVACRGQAPVFAWAPVDSRSQITRRTSEGPHVEVEMHL